MTEALVILGRKMLRVSFAIWRGNAVFEPVRLISNPPVCPKNRIKNREPFNKSTANCTA